MIFRAAGWLPSAWATTLAVLMLGPALGPGYVLSYDMVWVPDLALRSDFLGLGSGLPRAVPSDAVVATLDELLPGALLQKAVLLAALAGGGVGVARLVPADSLLARLVAVSVYVWNPFVAERLFIGHWPVLVGYAVLPWVIQAGRRARFEGRLPAELWLLVPLGALNASAGLVTVLVLAAFACRRQAARLNLGVAVLSVAANAPWLVAGLLHAGVATTSEQGVRVFGLNGEGSLPAPLAALGLGGIWNAEVVLPSRTTVAAVAGLAALVLLVGLGLRGWVAAAGARDMAAYAVCWGFGWGIAVCTWALPDQLTWLAEQVPGTGLLRDGSRWLALCAPALAVGAAHGAREVVRRLPARVAQAGAGVALVLLPLAVLPDAALGESGRLRAVTFPRSYPEAREVVADASTDGQRGDLLVLPFTSYRAPTWNGGRKVLDPLGRYLEPNYVASDVLSVSGLVIPGEDPRVREVARALSAGSPEARSQALTAAGIGVVVEDLSVPGSTPPLLGERLAGPSDFRVTVLRDAMARAVPWSWWVAVSMAWAAYLASLAGGVIMLTTGYLKARSAARA